MVAGPIYRTGNVTEATAFAATSAAIDEIKDAALDSEWWTSADDFTDSGHRYLVLENATDGWVHVVRGLSDGTVQFQAGEDYNSTTKAMVGRLMGLPGIAGAAGVTLDASGRVASCTLTSTNTATGWPTGASLNHITADSPWVGAVSGSIKYAISVTQYAISVNINDGAAFWVVQELEESYYGSTIDPMPIIGLSSSHTSTTSTAFIVRAPGYTGLNQQGVTSNYTGCIVNNLWSMPDPATLAFPFTVVDHASGKLPALRLIVSAGIGVYFASYPASARGPRGLTRSMVCTPVPTSQATGDTIVINGTRWMWHGNHNVRGNPTSIAVALWVDTGIAAT
jgi:hypothetical protein